MYEKGEIREALASNIKLLRKSKGFSAEELAGVLGMSTSNYYRMERAGPNGLMPDPWLILLLSSFYGVSTEELYGLALPKQYTSPEESVLLAAFRKMPEDVRKSFVQLAISSSLNRNSATKLEKIADLIRIMS